MIAKDPDPTLRRIERDACIVCGASAIVAVVVSGGRSGAALGVLAGGALIGASYWAIKRGASDLTAALSAASRGRDASESRRGFRRRHMLRVGLIFIARYALLVILAYAMIGRLRLHPIGLVVGVSSIVAAAAIEAIRILAVPRRSP